MRIRKKKWAEPELSVCNFYVKNPEENAGKWMQAFKKEQPLYLEIGCGKGGFAGQLALKNPDKNSPLFRMVPLENLLFLRLAAAIIATCLSYCSAS